MTKKETTALLSTMELEDKNLIFSHQNTVYDFICDFANEQTVVVAPIHG